MRSFFASINKHRSINVLHDVLKEQPYVMFEDVQGLEHVVPYITSLRSEEDIEVEDLYNYVNLRDLGQTVVNMHEFVHKRDTSYQFKVISRCVRGCFRFPDVDQAVKMLGWWLMFFSDSKTWSIKYDWIWLWPGNVMHIRGDRFWISDSSSLPFYVMKRLCDRYRMICERYNTHIVKLDESSIDFLKEIYGDKLVSVNYGVMEKSLFDTIISEHIRKHTPNSPAIKRWTSKYGININNANSASMTLSYIATTSPSPMWYSPIFMRDLVEERNRLLRNFKNETSCTTYRSRK